MTFREARALVSEVAADLRALVGVNEEAHLVTALLSAASLECALEDAGAGTPASRALTDCVATAYWCNDASDLRSGLEPGAWSLEPAALTSQRLRVSRPEGFAYYGVVPRDLGRAALVVPGDRITVVGVRTIGVALGAAVAAALRARGAQVQRFTVRPTGHPYDRVTTLAADQRRLVEENARDRFVVVDEGPGLSGSSLLSVAEALVGAGVSAAQIWLLGTRAVDPERLVTPDGARRWRRFRALVAEPAAVAGDDVSAGAWRARLWPDRACWPASWTALERRKLLVGDGRALLKFEGLGRHGATVWARAAALADAGWTAAPQAPPDARGFVRHSFLDGRPLGRTELDSEVLATIGRYIAARATLFPAEADGEEASAAARTNVALESGIELPAGWALPCERPVLADAHLQPHEWVRLPTGRLLKVDAIAHGDDHLQPGPVDVAWDLAGAAIEWQLDDAAREVMLAAYRDQAREDPRARLRAYELAYAAFRARACAMAAHQCAPDEQARLAREEARYHAQVLARI